MLNSALKSGLKSFKLVYVTDKRDGIMRQKLGKGFQYYDWAGKVLSDKQTLERIRSLCIPPAWDNVWICPMDNGHLQATGYDNKGRKQYIYHNDWIKICQENKFEKLANFGYVLPKIRRRVNIDMKLRGLPPIKVIATIVWLLEKTFIRVGNEEYAKDNNSFGLTTLRNKHVKVWGTWVKFEFFGKSGVKHVVNFSSPTVSKIIKKCIELPGYELFQYIDEMGIRQSVDSADVNDYLREITGEDITAKDFRTWGATLLCATLLCQKKYPNNPGKLKKCISEVIKLTAKHLRNTPKVCKNYYIHPQVIKSYEDNKLQSYFLKKDYQKIPGLNRNEVVLHFLLG